MLAAPEVGFEIVTGRHGGSIPLRREFEELATKSLTR
jgi:hypothetical protein